MRRYDVEYRESPSDDPGDGEERWTRLPHRPDEGAGSVVIDGLDLGVRYDVRTRLVDDITGAASPWTIWPGVLVEKDGRAPPAIASLRLTKNDCATWEMPFEVLDLRGFRLRHAPGVHDGPDLGWDLAEEAHEGIVTAAPFLLCRVPKGRRTLLARPVDWDENEGDPVSLGTFRGEYDDRAEFVARTVDYAAQNFAGGLLAGAPAGATLQAAAVSSPSMFPDGAEPWMSIDPDAPMFPGGDDDPMFGEFWGGAAPWFSRDGSASMFGEQWQWIEYVDSFTVHVCEEGPNAVLSANVACSGRGWRLMYRPRDPQPWFSADPFDDMFGAADDPMFPEVSTQPWRPWPGRLQGVSCGVYDFRLVVPGGAERARVTAFSVTLSYEARTRHVSGLTIPADGGTRAPPGDEWRRIVEVRPQLVAATEPVAVAVTDKSGAKGPGLLTSVPATVDVTLRGY